MTYTLLCKCWCPAPSLNGPLLPPGKGGGEKSQNSEMGSTHFSSTPEAWHLDAGQSGVQAQSVLHSKFESGLSSMRFVSRKQITFQISPSQVNGPSFFRRSGTPNIPIQRGGTLPVLGETLRCRNVRGTYV